MKLYLPIDTDKFQFTGDNLKKYLEEIAMLDYSNSSIEGLIKSQSWNT